MQSENTLTECESELLAESARLQALIDSAPFGAHMYTLAPDDQLEFVGYNRKAEQMLGIDHSGLIGKALEEAFPGIIGTDIPERFRAVAHGSAPWDDEHYAYDGNGISGVFEVHALAYAPQQLVVFFRDITQQHKLELDLARAGRALRTLSMSNQTLIRAQDEPTLLKTVCDIITQQSGHRMAWVGYAQHDARKSIELVAYSGVDHGYLNISSLSWKEGTPGYGSAGRAIVTGKPCIVHDTQTDPTFVHKEAARVRGYRSILCLPLTVEAKTLGMLSIYSSEPDAFGSAELAQLEELASDLSFGIETLRARQERVKTDELLIRTNERLNHLLRNLAEAMGRAIEARDPYLRGHQERTAFIAEAIAHEMHLPDAIIAATEMAALVHDIGKLSVPAEILNSSGRLSDIEFNLVKQHSACGYGILKDIDFPWSVADIVWQHHERLDGSGYPRGLKGDDILLPARIIAVADAIDAMTSTRPYRPALTIGQAMAELASEQSQYDADALRAFTRLHERYGDGVLGSH